MSAIIDGVEYHKVIKAFEIDNVWYAQIYQPEVAPAPTFNRIEDGENDTWYPSNDVGLWNMGSDYHDGLTRAEIEEAYGIKREYTE